MLLTKLRENQVPSTAKSNNGSARYGSGGKKSGSDVENSFADIGLTIKSKPLGKVQKYVLNSSFPRVIGKEEKEKGRRGIIRSGKCFDMFNGDSSFPYLNDSIQSNGISTRLNDHQRISPRKSFSKDQIQQATTVKSSISSSSKENSNIYFQTNRNSSSSSSNRNNSQQISKLNSFYSNENSSKSITYPIKPSEAISFYSEKLTEFEKNEIFDYKDIYYLGLEAEKINGKSFKDYDDENGSFIKTRQDHICYRFEMLETLGKGSFGLVLRCYDHKKKEIIALKILRNKKRFQQQGLVEVNILNHLKTLDIDNSLNIVHIKESFYFRSHLCITFELLGINLYELIKKNNYQGFSLHLVKRFGTSLLQCLRVMSRENIIHCDLKPENILLRQKGSSSIKVIDFGSGCFQSQRIYTYIQSRFYRAPEIILGIPYTPAIDIWSLGCILVELFTGYPIFPGENEQEQLAMIMEVMDLPPSHLLQQGTRKKLFFDSKGMPRSISTKSLKRRRPGTRPLGQILRTTDHHFIDFIERCLQWDPLQRLTAEDGLHHPWIIQTKLNRTSIQSNKISQMKKEDNFHSAFNADSYFSLNEMTTNDQTILNEDPKQTTTTTTTTFPRISNQ